MSEVPNVESKPTSKSKNNNGAYSLEFRQKVVNRAIELNNVSKACREFKLSTSLAHTWVKKFNEGGLEALSPKSRRPHHQPKKTSNWIIDKLF